MPIFTSSDDDIFATEVLGSRPDLTPDVAPDVGFLQALPESFKDTALGSVFSRESGAVSIRPARDIDAGFNPLDYIRGYEDNADSFIYSNNIDEVEAMKRQIDNEKSRREFLSSAGASGVAADIVTGIFDPLNLIPIGGQAIKAYSVGGSIFKNALSVAKAGMIGSSASEAVIQTQQETRTFGESAVNVAGSTFLAGILGGSVASISGKAFRDVAESIERDMFVPSPKDDDLMEPGSIFITKEDLDADTSVGSASVRKTTLAEETLSRSFGVAKVSQYLNPKLRAAVSPSIETRRIAQELVETPFYYEKNSLGISNPVAIESMINQTTALRGRSVVLFNDSYKSYTKRLKGTGDVRLSRMEFSEQVGRAMRRNDTSDIPEVAQAAKAYRDNLFEPLKQAAIKAGLLDKDVSVRTADSYLTRIWNVEKVQARRTELKGILVDWLRIESLKTDGNQIASQRSISEGLAEDEISEIADSILNNIIGSNNLRIPYDMKISTRGPLKERVLNIPDELIEEFLESDIEMIGAYYARTMAPDIALKDWFGTLDLFGEGGAITRRVNEDYNTKIDNAKNDKQRRALSKRKQGDLEDLQAMVGQLRGTYGAPANPDSIIVRSGRVVRDLQYLSKLGGVTLSSLADVARPVMVHGLRNTVMDGILPMISNFKSYKIQANEARLAGNAWDMVLDGRMQVLADVGNDYRRGTSFERGLKVASNTFGKVTLMTQWNTALKEFSAVVTQARIIKAVNKSVDGTISKTDARYLNMIGIDRNAARLISEQYKTHGSKFGGNLIANTEAWTNKSAIYMYRSALTKEIDRIIVTPGVGDKPNWMSSEMGKMIGQFRSFSFASTNKVLISGLQEADMIRMNGYLLAFGMGMLSYALKSIEAGRELSSDPEVWLAEGVDRSGLLGIYSEYNNISEKITGRGLNTLFGASPMSRYASRNALGSLIGPTFGTGEDAIRVLSGLSNEWTKQDTRALRRIIPYQNLIGVRRLFDEFEEGLNDSLGVRK